MNKREQIIEKGRLLARLSLVVSPQQLGRAAAWPLERLRAVVKGGSGLVIRRAESGTVGASAAAGKVDALSSAVRRIMAAAPGTMLHEFRQKNPDVLLRARSLASRQDRPYLDASRGCYVFPTRTPSEARARRAELAGK